MDGPESDEDVMIKLPVGALGIALLCASMAWGQAAKDSRPPTQLPSSIAPPQSEAPGTACDSPCCSQGPPFWLSADYLLWWLRSGPVNGPLITTGSAGDAIPGALGQPGTRVIFANNLSSNPFSGMRLQGGIGLGGGLALEGGYFFLERRADNFTAASDAGGAPVIARPVFSTRTGLQDAERSSNPGLWSGQTTLNAHTTLHGYEINLAQTPGLFAVDTGESASHVDLLLGYRALSLNEDLSLQDTLVPLAPALSFQGNPINAPSPLADFDKFHTRNQFYGGQLGARWQGYAGALTLGLTGKVALGANQELVTIEGASTLLNPGSSVTVPGGVLAVPSNIGRYYRSVFAVAPEAGVSVGWRLTERLSTNIGYTLIYISNVVRPGNQIDHTVNPTQVPTDQDFGKGGGPPRPAFSFHSSDFWAQGINLGLRYQY